MDEQHRGSVSKGPPRGVGRLADFAMRSLTDLETSTGGKPASGRPLVVAGDGSGDVRSVAEGVQLGGQGAKLLVKPGTYREALELTIDIEIEGLGKPSAVRLIGPDDRPAVLVTDGRHAIRNLTIAGGPHDLTGTVDVDKGALLLHNVVFADCPGASLSVSSKYATVEARDCSFRVDHGYVIEVSDAAGGSIEGCTLECEQQHTNDPEPLIRISGDQTDPVLRGNTLREGGIFVTDNATPRIEANRLEQAWSGFAIRIRNAAPLILANDFDLTSASGVYVEGFSRRDEPVIEGNRLHGNNRRTGFLIRGRARLVRNHVSGFTLGVDLKSPLSGVALIENTIEACDVGVNMSLKADASSRDGSMTGPDASISGTRFVDTTDEFRLGMSEVSAVGPITLADPPRLNPMPATSWRYGREDFMASEVWAWDEVQKLVDDFTRPNPARRVIATCDSPTLGHALALVATAAGERWPYVLLSVTDRSCELVAVDNHCIATETLPLNGGNPGNYAIDLSACRAAAAKLGDAGGQVTLFQDDVVLTIRWSDQIVIAKRQEPDLPDYERVMSPSPTDWTEVGLEDLRDALAEAQADETYGSGGVWIDSSPEAGVVLRWKAKGGEIRDRNIAVATVPVAFRVGLIHRCVAEMLGAWPAADLLMGVVAQDKPVHFRYTDQPTLRYGMMPLRAKSPDE